MLSEAAAHAKLHGKNLYIATMDARKAFDVVDHNQLKAKLFMSGICSKMWCLLDNLYTDMTEVVRWNNKYSRRYEVQQGVGQGRPPYSDLFKCHIKPLLQKLESSGYGIHIGPLYCGCPSVADDVTLIATQATHIQFMLNICYEFSCDNKYEIHPEKSSVTKLVTKPIDNEKLNLEDFECDRDHFKIGSDPIKLSQCFKQLGLD